MKTIAANTLLCVYLFLMVRPAVPIAADFVAHTLWAHHHHAHDHHGKHTHLQDDLRNATDDHQDGHKQLTDYKTELYFAPQPLEFLFTTAILSEKQQFPFHPFQCQAIPSATSPPPES